MELYEIEEGLEKLPDTIQKLTIQYEKQKGEYDIFCAKKLLSVKVLYPKESPTIWKAMITEDCEPERAKVYTAEAHLNYRKDQYVSVRKIAELKKIEMQNLSGGV